MDILEITDFIAGITIQVGNYFKIRKLAIGWFFTLIAVLYWFFRVNRCGFISQSFWYVYSSMVATYGFLSWKKGEKIHE